MRLCRRNIERRHPATRNGADRDDGVQHPGWMVVGGISRRANDLEPAVAPGRWRNLGGYPRPFGWEGVRSGVPAAASSKARFTTRFASSILKALVPEGSSTELYADSLARLCRSAAGLMARAADAGQIRGDIAPEDVMRAVIGICYAREQPGWQHAVIPLVDIFVDGLCLRP